MMIIVCLTIAPCVFCEELAQLNGEVAVYIDTESIEVKPGEEFTIEVKVDPGSYGISGGEINVGFNSTAFEVTEVSPGDLLGPSPLEGKKDIDNNEGTVSYAIARIGPTTPPTPLGAFAQIRFKVREDAQAGTYEIKLTEVGLTDEEFEDIPEASLSHRSVEVTATYVAGSQQYGYLMIGLIATGAAAVAIVYVTKSKKPKISVVSPPLGPHFCPRCHHIASYDSQKKAWFCNRCKRYVE